MDNESDDARTWRPTWLPLVGLVGDDVDVDEYDYLVADAEMDVLALVEDEVLLTLPYAPKHSAEDCSVKSEQLEIKAPNPFAALRDFKVVKK